MKSDLSVAAQVSPRVGGRLSVTVAALSFDEYGPSGTVWLPTPDTPRPRPPYG